MASIVKRKNRYSVVYTYTDENSVKRQKWETFATNAEAKKRKVQVEFEQETGTFIIPNASTVSDLLEEYMSIYGVNTWAMSTYEARRSLIFNYINPLIGDMKLEDVMPRTMDKYYQSLLTVKAKVVNNRKPTHEYLTAHTVREIHKLLRNAFNQGVKWELMSRNPVQNATLPKEEHKERDIWTVETLFKALEVCDDDNLSLALNLAFSCSLRMSEMLGLTWDCIDISERSIKNDCAYIFVNKELQRVNRNALEQLGEKGVMFKFPPAVASTHTALVLKEPKTKTSIRKIFLPKTVTEMLVKRHEDIENLKELFGEEYMDFNLVFASSCGRPIEGQVINRALAKLIKDNDLPPVVFHSFRHSSITYKLKLNGGDMKSVQGDSGHAQVKMAADVYSHIIDDDRRINAQRFEEQFYQSKAAPAAEEAQKETKAETASQTDQEMLMKLLANPEMAAHDSAKEENIQEEEQTDYYEDSVVTHLSICDVLSNDGVTKVRFPQFNICEYIATYRNEFFYCFFGYRELKLFEREFSKFSTGRKSIAYNKEFKKLLNKLQSVSEVESRKEKDIYTAFNEAWDFYSFGKKQDLKEYHENNIAKYKKIYENIFSYLKVLSEINYTKNNQRLMILTIIISIAAIFISVLTA